MKKIFSNHAIYSDINIRVVLILSVLFFLFNCSSYCQEKTYNNYGDSILIEPLEDFSMYEYLGHSLYPSEDSMVLISNLSNKKILRYSKEVLVNFSPNENYYANYIPQIGLNGKNNYMVEIRDNEDNLKA